MSDFEDNYFRENNDFEDEDDVSEKDDYEESYHSQRINSDSESERNSDSENDYRREKSELELLREKNIKKRDEFLAMLMNDPEYADVVASANELKKTNIKKISKPRKDPSFQYKSQFRIPVVARRSSRLQNIPPVYFKEDLIDEIEINRKRKRSQECDYYDLLETVIYHPKISRAPSRNTVPAQIVPVENITDDMIANIAKKGTIKIYSDEGTSCHQCRQKTKDQKTYCRSLCCVGVRGQFCGVCLENRYGEDVAVALKDPVWKCPVCRGICNCSFCRQKAGKRPTGILAPLAQQSGHKSVKDFLESLRGEGDYAHQDPVWKKLNDPNCLLGYSKDIKFAHMGKNVKHEIISFLSWEELKNFIWKKENELESAIDLHDEPRCLLGFFPSTDKALLDDGTHCIMGPKYLKFDQLIQKMQVKLDVVEKEYADKMMVTTRSLDDINKHCSGYLEETKHFFLRDKNEVVMKKFLHKVDINISDKHYADKVAEISGKKYLCMEGIKD